MAARAARASRGGRIGALLASEGDVICRQLSSQFDSLCPTTWRSSSIVCTRQASHAAAASRALVSENQVRRRRPVTGSSTMSSWPMPAYPSTSRAGRSTSRSRTRARATSRASAIDIDPYNMTVGDFANAAVASVPRTSRQLSTPRVGIRISSEDGYRFDFSNQLDSRRPTAAARCRASRRHSVERCAARSTSRPCQPTSISRSTGVQPTTITLTSG